MRKRYVCYQVELPEDAQQKAIDTVSDNNDVTYGDIEGYEASAPYEKVE